LAFYISLVSNGGLSNFFRHVVNGEILGVSLQLEDVLQNGLPGYILGQSDDSSGVTSTSSTLKVKDRKQNSRSGAKHSMLYSKLTYFILDSSISSKLFSLEVQ
jgi:hypothetical protein